MTNPPVPNLPRSNTLELVDAAKGLLAVCALLMESQPAGPMPEWQVRLIAAMELVRLAL